MPGNPSRDTYDRTKQYDRVRYIGGTGRRLFDAELNEMEDILQQHIADLAAAMGGQTAPPVAADWALMDHCARLQPSNDSDRSVAVVHGWVQAGPYGYFTTGSPVGSNFKLIVFTGGDSVGIPAAIYWDVYETVVDSTGDPNIVDPTYGVETAHRKKLNWVIAVEKNSTEPPTPPSGHYYLKLGVVYNNSALIPYADIYNNESQQVLSNLKLGLGVIDYFVVPWQLAHLTQPAATPGYHISDGYISDNASGVALTLAIPLLAPSGQRISPRNYSGARSIDIYRVDYYGGVGVGLGATMNVKLYYTNPNTGFVTTLVAQDDFTPDGGYGRRTITGYTSPAMEQDGYWHLFISLFSNGSATGARFYAASAWYQTIGLRAQQNFATD